MKKTGVSVLAMFLLCALLLSACSPDKPVTTQGREEALLQVFTLLYNTDPALNRGGGRFAALDVPDHALFEPTARERLEQWFQERVLEVRWTTMTELEEAGETEHGSITNGVLYSVTEIEDVSDQEIRFSAMKYRGPLGAIGGTFTLTFQEGQWVMSGGVGWIS